jgi:hypothetical protein
MVLGESPGLVGGATAHPIVTDNDPILQSIAWCRHT